nr:sigma-70 family RNA polymerase sigma factor [Microtetraspora sp. NBRC 13810]
MGAESRQSDAELLEAVRTGKGSAFGVLYKRHVAAARALAWQLSRSEAEVEDVVAETFTKILDLVRRGGGPEISFRPYLLTAVRRTVYERARGDSRQLSTDEIELYDPGVPFVDPALTGLERSLVAKAFMSLPDRWRMVLWHTEVENARPADIAPLLGLTANSVAALAYRAREGLRQAYLQMHLAAAPRQECRPVLGKMGAYVRGGLSKRENQASDEHLADCTDCRAVFHELVDVNQGMRVIVGPLIAGQVLTGYLTVLAKTGAVASAGGLGAVAGWLGKVPRQPAAVASGAVVAVAVGVAVAAFLVSGEEPAARPPWPPRAAPITTPSPPPAPPSAKPSASPTPPPPPSASPSPSSSASPSVSPSASPSVSPSASPSASPAERAPARARLVASIDPLGALVRDQPGIVGVRLRNDGGEASDELVAAIDLPQGVTMLPAAHGGRGAGALDPVGTVDGWSCRPDTGGARCTRGPLDPGDATAVFMRVDVAPQAPEGDGPAVSVTAGRLRVAAEAGAGVRTAGAAARFAADGRVVTRAVGNTLLTCPGDVPGCDRAREREGSRRDNDLWRMVAVDHDRDRTTKNSSAARLMLPEGGEVVWAGLYWSAGGSLPAGGRGAGKGGDGAASGERRSRSGVIGGSGAARDGSPGAGDGGAHVRRVGGGGMVAGAVAGESADGDGGGGGSAVGVRVRAPGSGRYVRVDAAEVVARDLPVGPGYQAFAEVTELVAEAGGDDGEWWVADMSLQEGVSRHAGWSLVVIATDPRGAYGQAVVLDTATLVDEGEGPLEMPLAGLTPTASPARVDLVTWEGDADLDGDTVTLGGAALRPEEGERDADNPFDGSAAGAVGPKMTFGVDVDSFRPVLGDRPVLRVATERDVVLFGVAAVSVHARS